MVLAAVGLASQTREPSEQQIRDALDGNFCRCTGYHNIVKSVKEGLKEMA
jgi:carbon-monoxide dehydrogenase small subunit